MRSITNSLALLLFNCRISDKIYEVQIWSRPYYMETLSSRVVYCRNDGRSRHLPGWGKALHTQSASEAIASLYFRSRNHIIRPDVPKLQGEVLMLPKPAKALARLLYCATFES